MHIKKKSPNAKKGRKKLVKVKTLQSTRSTGHLIDSSV